MVIWKGSCLGTTKVLQRGRFLPYRSRPFTRYGLFGRSALGIAELALSARDSPDSWPQPPLWPEDLPLIRELLTAEAIIVTLDSSKPWLGRSIRH